MLSSFPVEIRNLVFRESSPIDRIRFSLANKESNELVSSYNQNNFRIRRILSRYFDSVPDIAQFRLLQYETGMLISGSAALQFFDNTMYPESDLDLYVALREADPIGQFLLERGYTFTPILDQPGDWEVALYRKILSWESRPEPLWNDDTDLYPVNGIAAVFTFVKEGKRVQLITCGRATLEVILRFHSTCVMNVISHSHAYSLYPRATFEDRVSIHPRVSARRKDKIKIAFEKYTKRGWKILPVPSAAAYLRPNSEFGNGPRYVGDSNCWIIPLERLYEQDEVVPIEHQGVELPMHFEDDFVRANGWRSDSLDTFYISTKVFTSWYLEGQYCVCPDFYWDIQYFLDGLGDVDYGRRDREFTEISHKLYNAYNATKSNNKSGSITEVVQSWIRNTVANAFINLTFPSEFNVPYELYPRPATALELTDALKDLCNYLGTNSNLEVNVSFSLVSEDDQSNIVGGKPRAIRTIVDVSQTRFSDSRLLEDLNRSWARSLEPFNIELRVKAI